MVALESLRATMSKLFSSNHLPLFTSNYFHSMYTRLIGFATPDFDMAIKLRDLVLRQPLNMVFQLEDIAQEYDSYHVACFDDYNQIVGVLTLKPITTDILKMRQVAVNPNCQGQGIGTYLVTSAEAIALREGYNQFELHARETAVEFYKRLNYTISGKSFLEVGILHYKMNKKLG